MNDQDIITYIKQKLPKIVFNPIKFPNYGKSNALGFVITDDKLVIGYIKRDGSLCKLMNPIDISTLSNDNLIDILKKIPTVSGFTENDKVNLLRIFDTSQSINEKEQKNVQKMLANYISDPTKNEYIVKYDNMSNNYITIKKEYSDLIEKFETQLRNQQECNKKILEEKNLLINKINDYKTQVFNFINDSSLDIKDVRQRIIILLEKLKSDKKIIESIMQNMSQQSDFTNTIQELRDQLILLQNEINENKLEIDILRDYKNKCSQKIIQDKQQIIQSIKNYKDQWMSWLNNTNVQRKILIQQVKNQYIFINKKLEEVLSDNKLKESDIRKLKDSLNSLKSTIDTTTNEQLIAINAKYADEIEEYKLEIERQRQEIQKLNDDLNIVKMLLEKNQNIKIPEVTNYNDCVKVAYIFRKVNNQIMRKKEIIQKLKEDIIPKFKSISLQAYNLNDLQMSNNIIPIDILNDMENHINNIETRLNTHIQFFELDKYNIESKIISLENPSVKKTPELDQFCTRLNDINLYWAANEEEFFQDDIAITNIYEDLSGSVRVYVKIRPDENNTIRVTDPTNPRSLEVDCPSPENPQVFSNFYGVFDQSFTNKDVFTGVKSAEPDLGFEQLHIPNLDTSAGNIGLYNSFRQVENGYSIIIFGYGLSGSGKTRTLFGDVNNNVPGLIHYALTNLNNVESISIKNIFEQYQSKQNLQEGYLSGKIINLIGKIPPIYTNNKTYNLPQISEEQELLQYSIDDYKNISLSSLQEQLGGITSILEKHRIEKGRIKETPNNPVSSRSHLFIVFKIYFTNGTTGYLTFVDMAGRESPIDIYETFLDPQSYSLATFMLNGTNPRLMPMIQNKIYPEFSNYNVGTIHNMLEESFFINESINHMTYFFQKKNNKQNEDKKQLLGLDKYNLSRFYISPKQEELGNINPNKNCLMIPILQYLDNQGKSPQEFKPTKFIMMCNVRQELRYCKQIIETLKFANNVKST